MRITLIISIVKNQVSEQSVRFSLTVDEKEVGHAWLNILLEDGKNKEELKYSGLLGDVFIEESFRGKGLGTELLRAVIEEASKKKCTKLLALSRFVNIRAHTLYRRIGFREHGFEFRLDL